MSMLSRDFARPQVTKNNESKNGNTFRCELFNLIDTRQLAINASTKLCLEAVEFLNIFKNTRIFRLVPSPPGQLSPYVRPLLRKILRRPSTEVIY